MLEHVRTSAPRSMFMPCGAMRRAASLVNGFVLPCLVLGSNLPLLVTVGDFFYLELRNQDGVAQ